MKAAMTAVFGVLFLQVAMTAAIAAVTVWQSNIIVCRLLTMLPCLSLSMRWWLLPNRLGLRAWAGRLQRCAL